jgi:cell division protein FtsB
MEKKMNNKFSIGVVIAIVLQVSAFVWWTAQQAQTITQLKTAMAELTAKTEQEKQFNLQRDVADLKAMIADLERRTGESFELLAENTDNRFSAVYDERNG